MKKSILFFLFILIEIAAFSQNEDNRLYELRTYYTHPGRMNALIKRFTNHTTALFEKHGMTNVGYWLSTADSNKMMYVMSYPSLSARDTSWKYFMADPVWQKVAKDSELDGKILVKVESAYLKLTDFSPAVPTQDIAMPNRTFELRTYTMLPGRLPNILARFRNHTTKLFESHGMTNLPYWTTIEKDDKQPKLIYILAHKSEQAGKASFDAFRVDPAWIKVKTDSELDGKITEKVESEYMKPLPFSKIK